MPLNDPSAHAISNLNWSMIWSSVLRPGEKHPVPGLAHVQRGDTPWGEVTMTPFLCGQGLDSMQFHSKKMVGALKAAIPGTRFIGVIGLTGPVHSGVEIAGVRREQAFVLVQSAADIPRDPAAITSGTADDKTMRWVFGVLLGEAFADARLARPEVISATALSSRFTPNHQWRINLRLYSGNTARMVEGAAERIRAGLGGTPYLRVVPTEIGCELIVGAMPENVEYASAAAEDWARGHHDRVKRPVTPAGELDLAAAVARIIELGFEVTLRPLASAS